MRNLLSGERFFVKDIASNSFTIRAYFDNTNISDYDIEMQAILLSEMDKLEKKENFVFSHNKTSFCGGVSVNLNSKETINVDLNKIFPDITKVVFILAIKNPKYNQKLSDLNNLSFGMFDKSNQILEYKYPNLTSETSLIFFTLYKKNNGWKIKADNTGFTSSTLEILKRYANNELHISENFLNSSNKIDITCKNCNQINTMHKKNPYTYCTFCYKTLDIPDDILENKKDKSIDDTKNKKDKKIKDPYKLTFAELIFISMFWVILGTVLISFGEFARLMSERASFFVHIFSLGIVTSLMYGYASERNYAKFFFSASDKSAYLTLCIVGLFISAVMFGLLSREIYLISPTGSYIVPSRLTPLSWITFGLDSMSEAIFLDIPSIYDIHISNIRANSLTTQSWLLLFKMSVDLVLLRVFIKYSNLGEFFSRFLHLRYNRNYFRIPEPIMLSLLIIATFLITIIFGKVCEFTNFIFRGSFSTISNDWIAYGFYNLSEVIFLDIPDTYKIPITTVHHTSFLAKTMAFSFRITLDIFVIKSIASLWNILDLNNVISDYVRNSSEIRKFIVDSLPLIIMIGSIILVSFVMILFFF